MKKAKYLIMVAASMAMALVLTAPVLAASFNPVTVTITDAAEMAREDSVHANVDTERRETTPYPTDILLMEQGARNYLHKTYSVDANYDPERLVEPAFSQGGYRYRFSEIIQRDSISTSSTKTVTENKTVNSDTNDKTVILALLGNKLPYSDADGFMGELFLVPESLLISEIGKTSYSYTVSDTRRFDGLSSNDMANIPKNVSKNGMTLPLQTVDWQVSGSESAGYSEVPSEYTAIAYYSAPATGTKASGYVVTASFSGEAVKELVGKNIYTIVYEGEQIIIPFNYIPLIIIGAVIAGCIVALAVFWRLRKNIEVYVYRQGVPELYCKDRIGHKNAVIKVTQLHNENLKLVFSKRLASALNNQRVFVQGRSRNRRFVCNGNETWNLWLGDDDVNIAERIVDIE